MNQILHPVIEIALMKLPEFKKCITVMDEHSKISGLSRRTFKSYTRKLAQLSLKYNKLPEFCSVEDVNTYLAGLVTNGRPHSESDFKLAVGGLRFYRRALGEVEVRYKLPKIRGEKRLPAVLSKDECIRLFDCASRFKDRVMLKLIYSSGLRLQELCYLKIGDIDWLRMMIHIRSGKGRKDRYVCLSESILADLKSYFVMEKPFLYVFNNSRGARANSTTVCKIMSRAVKRAGITKTGVCLHTLRHSFATHLLEDGLDIVSIKEMLGHERLQTTLVYLHVANYERIRKFSPLDKLYPLEVKSETEKRITIDELVKITSNAKTHEEELRAQLNLFDED